MQKESIVKKQEKEEIVIKKITIPQEYASNFHNICKCGIYKELNRKKLITDTQLNALLRYLE